MALVTADRDQVEAIVSATHDNPFGFLGMQEDGGAVVVRAFLPDADEVSVVDARTGEAVAKLDRVHPEGFFAGSLKGKRQLFPYRLRATRDGEAWEIEDPYRFPPVLGELDLYLLGQGNHFRVFEKLGAHLTVIEGVAGVSFAVWAPNASRVSVIGPFNNWDGRRHPMRLRRECGVWEIFIPGLSPGALYKYELRSREGYLLPLKSDPYAFYAEQPPRTASVVYDLDRYEWNDGAWMARRAGRQALDAPISIYEVHLGSWRMREDNGTWRSLNYRELADELVPYVQEMGFTHIEVLPITEHPFTGSWGYQPTGMFAATSRFGTPDDLRYLIDRCHQAGIGVLMDWVPAHFPNDPHGLAYFDGTHLYEHSDPRKGQHMDWGTLIYNFGRTEVQNFLIASALFWIEKYHIDGLRVDAVASMLYLDYSRNAGEWIPNEFGGNENLEAIAFLKRMNELIYGRHDGAITIAEESTAWPGVSRPVYLGGLGFGYKWNMGWMHDTLNYISEDPIYRRYHQDQLTFGLLYAFSENFVLPISHDEVVHGKGSLFGKMPGDRWQKFANLRAYLGFMFTHPGKKLLFMGNELAQEREWNHDRSLDWHLLEDPMNRGAQRLVAELNRMMREIPALHRSDVSAQGFEWIDARDSENSVIAYLRRTPDSDQVAVVVCNFTPLVRHDYRVGVPGPGLYRQRLNTDSALFGGSGIENPPEIQSEPAEWHGRPASVVLTLPPLATLVLIGPAAGQ